MSGSCGRRNSGEVPPSARRASDRAASSVRPAERPGRACAPTDGEQRKVSSASAAGPLASRRAGDAPPIITHLIQAVRAARRDQTRIVRAPHRRHCHATERRRSSAGPHLSRNRRGRASRAAWHTSRPVLVSRSVANVVGPAAGGVEGPTKGESAERPAARSQSSLIIPAVYIAPCRPAAESLGDETNPDETASGEGQDCAPSGETAPDSRSAGSWVTPWHLAGSSRSGRAAI